MIYSILLIYAIINVKLCWLGLSVEAEDVPDKIILEYTQGDQLYQHQKLLLLTFRVKTHLKWIFSFMKEEKYKLKSTGGEVQLKLSTSTGVIWSF